MEIELIQDGKVVDYNKYQEVIENVKESLFRRNKDKAKQMVIRKGEIYLCSIDGLGWRVFNKEYEKNRIDMTKERDMAEDGVL